MTFLVGQALQEKVRHVLGGNDVKCAVAFWGAGAEKYFEFADPEKKVQIICNLSMGGTNPRVIRSLLKNHSITQSDDLHAKVYVSDLGAVIGSANMSINGLGVESLSDSKWEEAAFFTQDAAILSEITSWFVKLESREITEVNLDDAQKKFDDRKSKSNKKAVDELYFPIISWYDSSDPVKIDPKNSPALRGSNLTSEQCFDMGMNYCPKDSIFLCTDKKRVVLFDINDGSEEDIRYFRALNLDSNLSDDEDAPDFVYDGISRKLVSVQKNEQRLLKNLLFSEKYKKLRGVQNEPTYLEDLVPTMSAVWREFRLEFPSSNLLKQPSAIKGQSNG